MSITRRTTAKGEVRYDARLRDPSGRVYGRTFRTKREAEHFVAAQRSDRARGLWFDVRAAETPFAEVALDWLHGDPGKRPGTVARDGSVVRTHLLPALGSRPIGRISPKDVQRLVTDWSARYRPATVRRHYACLRAIFGHAVATDIIGRSPCRAIKLPVIEHQDRLLPDPEQLAAVAEALGPSLVPMVYVGAVLGLRWGECAGLRVRHVDFFRSTVTVAEQITRGRGGTTVNGPPKTRAGRRTLAVPEQLVTMLADHLVNRGLTVDDANSRLFVSRDGRDLEYTNFRERNWVPACTTAGVPGLRFHDLRRLAATTLVAEGVDVKTTQTRLGHASPQMTLGLYAQATNSGDRSAATKVGHRLMGSIARDGRAMDAEGNSDDGQAQRPDQEELGGANKNRTCDLSIISSSQAYDLADIGRYATF